MFNSKLLVYQGVKSTTPSLDYHVVRSVGIIENDKKNANRLTEIHERKAQRINHRCRYMQQIPGHRHFKIFKAQFSMIFQLSTRDLV